MSKLIERYGCRKMTIIGGAIGAFGFIISSLCTSIEQLYFTIGIIGGLGLSSPFIVGLLTVERWFDSKRNLAIGLVSAGTGFGTFIFPPITQLLLDTLKWRLTLVCLSCLLMAISLIGAFLEDPQWKIEEDLKLAQNALDQRSINADESQNHRNGLKKLKTFLDFSHFKDKNFAILGVTTFIIYALYNTAIFFLSELLEDFGYNESQSANFLSVTGLFLMMGMIVLGWSADKKQINVVWLNAVCVFCE